MAGGGMALGTGWKEGPVCLGVSDTSPKSVSC